MELLYKAALAATDAVCPVPASSSVSTDIRLFGLCKNLLNALFILDLDVPPLPEAFAPWPEILLSRFPPFGVISRLGTPLGLGDKVAADNVVSDPADCNALPNASGTKLVPDGN